MSIPKFPSRNLAVFPLAILLSGCGGPVYVYRYKLTVDADINGKQQELSTVVEVSTSNKHLTILGYYPMLQMDGDAIVFNVSQNEALAIPLSDPDPPLKDARHAWGFNPTKILCKVYDIPLDDLKVDYKTGYNAGLAKLLSKTGDKIIDEDDLPDLLLITDKLNPNSGRYITAHNTSADNGLDVKFTQIKIGLTSDSPSRGIESKIPGLQPDKSWRGAYGLFYRRTWIDRLFEDWLGLG